MGKELVLDHEGHSEGRRMTSDKPEVRHRTGNKLPSHSESWESKQGHRATCKLLHRRKERDTDCRDGRTADALEAAASEPQSSPT